MLTKDNMGMVDISTVLTIGNIWGGWIYQSLLTMDNIWAGWIYALYSLWITFGQGGFIHYG